MHTTFQIKVLESFTNIITGSYSSCIFNILRNLHTLSIVAVPLYAPTNSNSAQGFPLLHALTKSVLCSFFGNTHYNRCEIVTYCSFHFHFSDDCAVENLYMCLLAISMYLLEKCLFHSSGNFLIRLFGNFGVLSIWVPYLFWILMPFNLSLQNFFSHSYFIWLMVLLLWKNSLIYLIKSHLFMLSFIFSSPGKPIQKKYY